MLVALIVAILRWSPSSELNKCKLTLYVEQPCMLLTSKILYVFYLKFSSSDYNNIPVNAFLE